MLTLNYRDSEPIYGQIKNGLKKLIVTGALAPGEKLRHELSGGHVEIAELRHQLPKLLQQGLKAQGVLVRLVLPPSGEAPLAGDGVDEAVGFQLGSL